MPPFARAGEHDHVVSAKQMRPAGEDYAAAGFETKVRIYPKVGYAFPLNRDTELRTAISFVLQR